MLADYAFIGVFFVIALAFPLVPLVGAYLLSPKRPTDLKQSPYECGLEAVGDVHVQFRVQYYMYALAFVIFDIEIVFLYPLAVAFNQVGMLAVGAMVVFIGLLAFGLVYELKKGALEWD